MQFQDIWKIVYRRNLF